MQAVLDIFTGYVVGKFLDRIASEWDDWISSCSKIFTRCKAFLVRCFCGNRVRAETLKDVKYLNQEELFISMVKDASQTIKVKPTKALKEIMSSSHLETIAIDIEHVMNSPGYKKVLSALTRIA